MANYYGVGRSNYFGIKDINKFKAWADRVNASWHTKDCEDAMGGKVYCVIAEDECGDLASQVFIETEDTDEIEEIDPLEDIPNWLDPRYVFVFTSVGHEKCRYVDAYAIAVNGVGEKCYIALHDIYNRATEKFGREVTITEALF